MKLLRKNANCKTVRTRRASILIQKELGRLLKEKSLDPRFQHVVITHIDLSPDFKRANLFVTVLGADEVDSKKKVLVALNKAAPFFRSLLAGAVKLRSTPRLIFIDESRLKKPPAIEELIQQLA